MAKPRDVVAADPEYGALVTAGSVTPPGIPYAQDPLRYYVTAPETAHLAPNYHPPVNPAHPLIPIGLRDLNNPPQVLIRHFQNLRPRNEAPVFNLQTATFAATACILISDLLANNTMDVAVLNSFPPNLNLKDTYHTETKGLIAYIAYCVGHGSFNVTVSTACRTCHQLIDTGSAIHRRANTFGAWICRVYPVLFRNHFLQNRLDWSNTLANPDGGIKHLNIRSHWDQCVRRLKFGGTHSSGWIINRRDDPTQPALLHEDVGGMLWQILLITRKITTRLDKNIGQIPDRKFHITNQQKVMLLNTRRLFNV